MSPSQVVVYEFIPLIDHGGGGVGYMAAGGGVALAGAATCRGVRRPSAFFFFFVVVAVLAAAFSVGRQSLCRSVAPRSVRWSCLRVCRRRFAADVPPLLPPFWSLRRRIHSRRWVSGAAVGVHGCGGGQTTHSYVHRGRG